MYDSIVLQAYWFSGGDFWVLSADGYLGGDSEPENIDLEPNSLCKNHIFEEVRDHLLDLADDWFEENKAESISILINGNEAGFVGGKLDFFADPI